MLLSSSYACDVRACVFGWYQPVPRGTIHATYTNCVAHASCNLATQCLLRRCSLRSLCHVVLCSSWLQSSTHHYHCTEGQRQATDESTSHKIVHTALGPRIKSTSSSAMPKSATKPTTGGVASTVMVVEVASDTRLA